MSRASREREKARHAGQKVMSKEEYKEFSQTLDLGCKPIKVSWGNVHGRPPANGQRIKVTTVFPSEKEIKPNEPNLGGDMFEPEAVKAIKAFEAE